MVTMQARRARRGCGIPNFSPSRTRTSATVATRGRQAGYTLIEAIGTLLVLAMLTSLAINSFASYAKRARAADALEQLDLYHMRMEKAFLDNGNYGVGSCAVTPPTTVVQFSYTCTLAADAQSYTATATGSLGMNGFTFQIDDKSTRTTRAFPDATVPANCWMVEKNKCQ
jgi:type IV pilus assembly protein PilE